MTDNDNDRQHETHPPVAPIPEEVPEPYRSSGDEDVFRGEIVDADWSIGTGVWLVVVMVALTVMSGVAVGFARLQGWEPTVEAIAVGSALSASYLLVLLIVWAASRRRGVSFFASIGLRPVPLRHLLAWGFGLALVGRFIAAVWGILLQLFDVELPGADIDPTRVFGDGAAGIILTVLLGVILAPIVEEVVFRGVLLPALSSRLGRWAGTALSSAAFAAVHLYAFSIPPIFVLAVLLAVSFIRTRSLWVPIVAHALFNGIGIGLVYLARGMGVL